MMRLAQGKRETSPYNDTMQFSPVFMVEVPLAGTLDALSLEGFW